MNLKKSFVTAAALLLLAGCSTGSTAKYTPGTYTGTAEGHNGDVVVEVTVSEDAITAVKVIEHEETDGISDGALDTIPDAIVDANSVEVDTVAGCTDTSEAIINAVSDALSQAK